MKWLVSGGELSGALPVAGRVFRQRLSLLSCCLVLEQALKIDDKNK
jgi:hypothetical protein